VHHHLSVGHRPAVHLRAGAIHSRRGGIESVIGDHPVGERETRQVHERRIGELDHPIGLIGVLGEHRVENVFRDHRRRVGPKCGEGGTAPFIDHDRDFGGSAGAVVDTERALAADQAAVKEPDALVVNTDRVGHRVEIVVDLDRAPDLTRIDHVPIFLGPAARGPRMDIRRGDGGAIALGAGAAPGFR